MASSAGHAKVQLNWNDKEIVRRTQDGMTAGLREAGKLGRRAIKFELAGAPDSPEGGPPGKVTGRLQKAIAYRVKKRAGKFSAVDIGVLWPSRQDEKFPGEMHAIAVRLARGFTGTDRRGRTFQQRGRPFVIPTLQREKSAMAELIRSTAKTYTPKARRS